MAIETGVITYNLNERGRKHTGVNRNFNIQKLCSVINSPRVQEMIKAGDMLGYYGHLPRQLAGLTPTEGAVVGGKYVKFDFAVCTTYLKAYPDGRIEHNEKFLDTEAGVLAAKLWQSETGGFSSAIEGTEFKGFDYVYNPNFVHNRGWSVALDSATMLEGAMLDNASMLIEDYNDHVLTAKAAFNLLGQVSEAHNNALIALDSVSCENEYLKQEIQRYELKLASQITVSTNENTQIFDSADSFKLLELVDIEESPLDAVIDVKRNSGYVDLISKKLLG